MCIVSIRTLHAIKLEMTSQSCQNSRVEAASLQTRVPRKLINTAARSCVNYTMVIPADSTPVGPRRRSRANLRPHSTYLPGTISPVCQIADTGCPFTCPVATVDAILRRVAARSHAAAGPRTRCTRVAVGRSGRLCFGEIFTSAESQNLAGPFCMWTARDAR